MVLHYIIFIILGAHDNLYTEMAMIDPIMLQLIYE